MEQRRRTNINFVVRFSVFFSHVLSWTEIVLPYSEQHQNIQNRWCSCVIKFLFLIKIMSLEIVSIFGVFHRMERVWKSLLPFFTISCVTIKLPLEQFLSFTNQMHMDLIFVIYNRFKFLICFIRCFGVDSTKKNNSHTENLMSRKNQIHCIIRLMTCCVHLTAHSIVPWTLYKWIWGE